jgi:hypothetical protein
MRRMIKLSVIAALVTVLAHTLHHPSDADNAPSQNDMREYGRILQMLGTLALKSSDSKLATARDLCMSLFSKVDASRKAKLWVGPTSASGAEPAEVTYLSQEMIFP